MAVTETWIKPTAAARDLPEQTRPGYTLARIFQKLRNFWYNISLNIAIVTGTLHRVGRLVLSRYIL